MTRTLPSLCFHSEPASPTKFVGSQLKLCQDAEVKFNVVLYVYMLVQAKQGHIRQGKLLHVPYLHP